MSFPSSPITGQVAIVNNIAYQYTGTTNSWQRYVTGINYGGNITAGTLTTTSGLFWANGTPYLNYSNSNVAAYLPSYSGALNPLSLNVGGTVTMGGSMNFNATGYQINNFNGRPMLLQTGGILQIIQTSYTTPWASSSTGSWIATPLSAGITPTSASSKILVTIQLATGQSTSGWSTNWGVQRNGTQIGGGVSTSGAPAGVWIATDAYSSDNEIYGLSQSYLDTPGTSSALTYLVTYYGEGNTGYLNRNGSQGSGVNQASGVSTITLMEIAQ